MSIIFHKKCYLSPLPENLRGYINQQKWQQKLPFLQLNIKYEPWLDPGFKKHSYKKAFLGQWGKCDHKQYSNVIKFFIFLSMIMAL